ncbi:MAG: SGNH/GDSL hydrolase family protein [Mycobacteriaceae bacterium]
MRFSRIFLLSSATVLVASALSQTGQASAESDPIHYVALGDSFTAIAGLPLDLDEVPLSCIQSKVNYPKLVAAQIGADLTDVSCGGAVAEDFAMSQQDDIAPQYDALTLDTTLVTVGIGGNNIGLVGLAEKCLTVADIADLPGLGHSCARENIEGEDDVYAQRVDSFAPRYRQIVAEIKQRSPRASVYFVGYPTAIRPGGCFPSIQALPEDADYLQARIDQLNAAMKHEVESVGAHFVSLRESTVGHDACAPQGVRWLEAYIPAMTPDAFVPLHPNGLAAINAAEQVVAAIND